MLSKFTESLTGNLAEHWAVTILAPAFTFWSGCILVWVNISGWSDLRQLLSNLSEIEQLSIIIGCLLLFLASSWVVQTMTPVILRLLAGHWPSLFDPVRLIFIRWQNRRVQKLERLRLRIYNEAFCTLTPEEQNQHDQPNLTETRRHEIVQKMFGQLATSKLSAYARADLVLLLYPPRPEQRMPTRFGNILRAAELRPQIRYGLDTYVCWPRLWLVLPKETRDELVAARKNLNLLVQLLTWGMLFVVVSQVLSFVGGLWVWWGLIAGILVIVYLYHISIEAAVTYGDLLTSAFDIHRIRLYQALRLPPPSTTDELAAGHQVTAYLFRGPPQVPISFCRDPEKSNCDDLEEM